MPITQASWLTNLTEKDLTENLSGIVTDLQEELLNNNNNIGDLIEDKLVSVKNAIADISLDISALENSMPTNLIGGTSDAYGTATTGSVMGKLNYLIYLLAPTPTTINYSSAGTFNNITIGTGIKFISITACGGSGGGRVGTFYNGYQGNYRCNTNYSFNTTGFLYSTCIYNGVIAGVNCYYKNTSTQNITNLQTFFDNAANFNYNAYGRRINFNPKWENQTIEIMPCQGGGSYVESTKNIYKTVTLAKNIATAGGNAGVTASVSSQTLNVATSEVITVTVGAGGGNSAAGAASTVVGTNGTKSFSGGAAGAAGNTLTYSNWTTTANYRIKMLYNNGSFTFGTTHWGQAAYNGNTTIISVGAVTSPSDTTITLTGSNGKTASANSLSRKGGAGGKGAAGAFLVYANGHHDKIQNFAGSAGSTGDPGYVRVSW